MYLTSESKVLLGIVAATIAVLGIGVFIFSRPPAPPPSYPKTELVPSDAWNKGNASASAYLVEFSDFQCPACRQFQPVVDELVEKYKENLTFVYRHFPLDQHRYAVGAAQAAEAAGVQGKFWEMYALLFANQEKFADTLWLDLAKQLDLDSKRFEDSMLSSSLKEKVERDRTYGISIGINATPTFFLNGAKLTVTSTGQLKDVIDKTVQKP